MYAFAPDYFDYIVIDEFHHAVTEQYRRIVEYFKPHFLLGLTATPERMDGKNIYEICDYNVPYEISLKDAINKGVLVPFHYYGVYDETDYSTLHVVKGRYDEKELNETYIGNTKRYDLIYKYYMKYSSKRALGFCCSRLHAEAMAEQIRDVLSTKRQSIIIGVCMCGRFNGNKWSCFSTNFYYSFTTTFLHFIPVPLVG